jgi:hypothetical protein
MTLALPAPVVDDGLDEAGLVDVLAFALADDDGLFVDWDEALAEVVDTRACVGDGLVQLELGVGWGVCWPAPAELVLALGLGLGLGDTDGVFVGLSLGLALGLVLALELVLALAEELAELAVLLPLDDVAGAVAFPVALLGGLVVADVVA